MINCPVCNKQCSGNLLCHLQDAHGILVKVTASKSESYFTCPCGETIHHYPVLKAAYEHVTQNDKKHRIKLMLMAVDRQ